MGAFTEIAKRVAKLEELMNSGRSFTDAVNEIVPPPAYETTLMRRASVVRVFDQAMFDSVIRADHDASFEDFIRTFGVERIQPSSETYRVADPVAADCLDLWIKEGRGRQELIQFTSEVHNHLLSRHPKKSLELLRFQIPGDPTGGLAEFNRLFDQADKAFDLATCHALVQTLRELDNFTAGLRSVPLKLLSPELRSRCDQLIPYVAARGRFIEEYGKSAKYLQRDGLFAEADKFLESNGCGMFPVYGAGGCGKTMFLRWLVARHCVPKPKFIPVAKVDFDDINIAKLEKFPWLILVQLAEQLNWQIAGAPLTEYLDRHAEYLPVLLPTSRLPEGIRVDGLEGELERSKPLGEQAIQDFAHKLMSQGVVALMLDTLEEAELHFPGALRAVLRMFKEIWRIAGKRGQVKLILSGRYDLKWRKFLEEEDPAPIKVGPFSEEESLPYLKEIRHIKPRLIPAIIAKAQGNPFILSLIADLVEQKDIKDVNGVEELKPEFAYLIRRVIDRIPDSQRAVRWVIRYGVVPQQLTKDFIKNVMEKHLRRELEQNSTKHKDKVSSYDASFLRGDIVDVEALWAALCSYADSSGWLRGTKDVLRFQPEVVQPMRALLKKEEIYPELHRDAAKWFEDQARGEQDAHAWARFMAEAFYHRLQVGDLDLQEWWERQLSEQRAQGTARHVMLEVVTKFLPTRAEVPKTPKRSPLLSFDFLGKAHLELAKMSAGIGWGPCRVVKDQASIRKLLGAAQAYLGDSEAFVRASTLVEMALALNDREYDKALGHAAQYEILLTSASQISLTQAARSRPALRQFEAEDLYAFHLVRARALAGKKEQRAESDYKAAISKAIEHGDPPWDLLSESGRELARMGQLARGLAVFREALTDPDEAPAAIRLEAAELFLEAGDYEEAAALASSAGMEFLTAQWSGTPERFRVIRVRVLCALVGGRLLEAKEQIDGLTSIGSDPLQVAQMKGIRGLLANVAYDTDLAIRLLQEAMQGYASAGEREAAERLLLVSVRVMKELRGDWATAWRMIMRTTGLTSDFLAIERAHLQRLAGGEIHDLADRDAKWILAMVALLTRNERSFDKDLLTIFLRHLETVEPVSLRYDYLHFFRWALRLEAVSDLRDEFLRLLPPPNPGNANFFPRVFGLIEALRCLGADSSARELLYQAYREVNDQVFVYDRLIAAACRLEADLPPITAVLENCNRVEEHGLAAATKIRLLSALIDRKDRRAEQVADVLGTTLPEYLLGTQFEAWHLISRSQMLSETDKEEAGECFQKATAILQILGQPSEGPRLLARRQADEKRMVVTLRSVPNPFEVRPTFGESEVAPFHVSITLAEDRDRAISQMREALPEGTEIKPIVELAIDGANTAGLPWEWAMSEHQLCFRSVQTMPGAVANPLRQSLDPVRVAILRPHAVHQERLGRGFELVSRRPLAEIYRSHGAKVFEPSALTTEAIVNVFRNMEPELIHIQASMVERHGLLAIDLPLEDEANGGSALLGVDFWTQQLRSVASFRRPVVILDPPRPTSDVEVARQLQLRNLFAADLAAKGESRAVLCAGLFEPNLMELAAELLATEVAGNPQFQQLLMLLRMGLKGDDFCTKGAALFVTQPEALLK
jgi:hypothetical protein